MGADTIQSGRVLLAVYSPCRHASPRSAGRGSNRFPVLHGNGLLNVWPEQKIEDSRHVGGFWPLGEPESVRVASEPRLETVLPACASGAFLLEMTAAPRDMPLEDEILQGVAMAPEEYLRWRARETTVEDAAGNPLPWTPETTTILDPRIQVGTLEIYYTVNHWRARCQEQADWERNLSWAEEPPSP